MDWLRPPRAPVRQVTRYVRNRSARPAGAIIDTIVLHDTGSLNPEGALAWFDDPASQASAHLLVDRDGALWRPVPYREKAWHAGRSSLWGREDLNATSVGIELVDVAGDPYPDAQLETLLWVTLELCREFWHIAPNRIIGHEHVAPGRKVDPGLDFAWRPYLVAVGYHLGQLGAL